MHGPVYVIRLAGQIAVPALQMSFSTYDFGHCFVYQAGMSISTAQLKLTNADDKDLMYASLRFCLQITVATSFIRLHEHVTNLMLIFYVHAYIAAFIMWRFGLVVTCWS